MTPQAAQLLTTIEEKFAQDFGHKDTRSENIDTPHLLFVEDEPTTRMMITQLLKGENVALSFATNVEEAVAAYCANPPHILFLDIDLGDSLTGLDLLDVIFKSDPLCYPIMLTSNATLDSVQRARAGHVKGYVIKPFSTKKLKECIQTYQKGVMG